MIFLCTDQIVIIPGYCRFEVKKSYCSCKLNQYQSPHCPSNVMVIKLYFNQGLRLVTYDIRLILAAWEPNTPYFAFGDR